MIDSWIDELMKYSYLHSFAGSFFPLVCAVRPDWIGLDCPCLPKRIKEEDFLFKSSAMYTVIYRSKIDIPY